MQVNIKGKIWKVSKFNSYEPVTSFVGSTNKGSREIFVSEHKGNEQETVLTIIHELTHAYFYETGLRNLEDMEETFCYWLEACYLEILENAINIANELFGLNIELKKEKTKKRSKKK